MFSGIVEGTAKVVSNDKGRLVVDLPIEGVVLGESIAIDGVCLTVVGGYFDFDVSEETLRKTTLGLKKAGDRINYERSLKVGDRISGHFVTGHVDCVGRIRSIIEEGNSVRFTCDSPEVIRKFIVPKGSVTVSGVSLTVGEVGSDSFSFYVIPHTKEITTLGDLQIGSLVNLEADILARYVRGAC